jgi:hypothetical protein
MSRTLLVRLGATMAVAGLLTMIGSVLLPWARVRTRPLGLRGNDSAEGLSVLSLTGGVWFVGLALVLLALVGAAALGTGTGRKIAGLAAPVIGLVATIVTIAIGRELRPTLSALETIGPFSEARVAGGAALALLASPLLGFAAGFLAIGRARRPAPVHSGQIR